MIRSARSVDSLLRLVRLQLQMDVAFVSIIHDGRRTIRNVSTQGNEEVEVGGWDWSENTYCQLVIDDGAPSVIADTSVHAQVAALALTRKVSIGAHIGVPIFDREHQIYGSLCAYTHRPRPDLTNRDAHVLEVLAELLYELVEQEDRAQAHWSRSAELVDDLVLGVGAVVVWQPVCDLQTRSIIGFEALSRFESNGPIAPSVVFEIAHSVAKGCDLELAMIERALQDVDTCSDNNVSLNLSPLALCDPRLANILHDSLIDLSRIVLELTEHEPVADYGRLRAALRQFRRAGTRCAVDDLGAGFASLRHALELEAEMVKVDISIVRGIDTSPRHRAVVEAIMTYATSTNTAVIAEGIETADELQALREIGVPLGQGYLLGRPTA